MIKNRKFAYFEAFFTLLFIVFAFFMPVWSSGVVFAKEQKAEITSAKAMAVIERTSGRILYSKNEKERLPMASTTKIITAIYVIEHNDDLDRVVEIPKEAVGVSGTSIGLKEGEHLTIRELLYGLMLRSGNDSAVALAIATSGSEEKFIDDVNKFLADKGFNDTLLSNPHGLPSENHYTTASDLAGITAYALNNETFREIVSTKEKKISNELNSKTSRNLIGKNKLLKNYEYADGVKTGYTRKAGRCFVGSATKDGMQLICVLLNCNPMFEECQSLLEKGFNEYKMYKLVSKDDIFKSIDVEKSEVDEIALQTTTDFSYPLKRSELGKINMQIDCDNSLVAPIKSGENIATITITLENQLIFSDKIYTINNIEPNTYDYFFKKIIKKM